MNVEELFSDSEESGEEEDAEWVPVKAAKGTKKSATGVRSLLSLYYL